MADKQNGYNASNIRVLHGLEPVRERPGMYIGSTDERGLHHLVYEVIDNCIDEAMAGYCTKVEVELLKDGACKVTDNGRGIPTGVMKDEGVSAVEVVLTKLHAGGKFGDGGYEISGGLHGVGVSCVNALSEKMIVEVAQDGALWTMDFARGIPQNHLTKIANTQRRGTTIIFYPDPDIFETVEFNYDTLKQRIKELAFLNKGLIIDFKDSRPLKEQQETFCFEGGICQYVKLLNQNEPKIKEKDDPDGEGDYLPVEPLYFDKKGTFTEKGKVKKYEVEIAMQYNGSSSGVIHSYANNINTQEGGHHLEGFKYAIAKVVNSYIAQPTNAKTPLKVSADHCREGLVAIINVKLEGPQFEGQTKTKLGTPGIRKVVADAVEEKFGGLLEESPTLRDQIVAKALLAKKAADAAQAIIDKIQKTGIDSSFSLPGKFADCLNKDKPQIREVYIVEGQSAGGTAKEGRDRRFQAILPLRGKILNVEKVSLHRMLDNEEIRNMITIFGCGIDQPDDKGGYISKCDVSKLKFDKIISMTDADVDGSHIRILLLTFIYKYMRPLILEGHVYSAQPPLFKATPKVGSKEPQYFYNDQDLEDYLVKVERKAEIQRYKGLGEMDKEQLWETTLDPERRTLLRVTVEDAERAVETFNVLMGDEPELRRQFIEENATLVKESDLDV